MMTGRFLPCIIALILILTPLTADSSVVIRDISFAERRQVAQQEVQLIGTAILTWGFVIDVYAGAFYLPDGHPGAGWVENVPKVLELSYLRPIKAADFSRASDSLLKSSLAPADYERLAERLGDFYQLFRDIGPGDRYSLVYHPMIGTELRLNGALLGTAAGHDFAVAYFGIWLGSKPINTRFRDRLLGG